MSPIIFRFFLISILKNFPPPKKNHFLTFLHLNLQNSLDLIIFQFLFFISILKKQFPPPKTEN